MTQHSEEPRTDQPRTDQPGVDPTAVRYERDEDGIVTLTLDDPGSSANTMNARYVEAMGAAVDRLEAERDDVVGVVVTSAKRTSFAGGDLGSMLEAGPEDAPEVFATAERVKAQLRRLERLGRPVVAAINGTALGGGFEIALACHRRIVLDDPRIQLGLPEVTLGLLPGGGGVTRTVRMLGLSAALSDVLLLGPRMSPAQAKEKGLVDALVTSPAELLPAARGWIQVTRDGEGPVGQPWDAPGYRMPGGTPSTPKLAALLPALPATLRRQLKGADYPAPRAILAAAVEGAQVDVDTASRIESRYLTHLLTGRNAHDMIQAFFFDLEALHGGALRPEGVDAFVPTRVAVLGAGMMGVGIAYSCARSGLEVVLKDVDAESAERGRAHAEALLVARVARGRMSESQARDVLARITPTADPADLSGCDVVIEAVFEDPGLKAAVYAETEPVVASDALLCSNTSTLPISGLAEGSTRPEDFVGLHFFSPVDKMPVVEIIRGARTSPRTVARAIDVVRALGKTPIVVNDSRGFFTSRVIGTRLDEGLTMLAEGVHPVSIERAATQAGYPVGPLQLCDELNLELLVKIRAAASVPDQSPGPAAVVDAMIAAGRPGRLRGAGFYDYDHSGSRLGLWAGLAREFPVADRTPAFGDLDDLKDRFLYIEAVETARCFAEGVLDSSAAANIGSIMGIGFPPRTGGTARLVTGHVGGMAGFVARAEELAETYGERFAPPSYLVDLAASGGSLPR